LDVVRLGTIFEKFCARKHPSVNIGNNNSLYFTHAISTNPMGVARKKAAGLRKFLFRGQKEKDNTII
jgi:hypothetical protein